MDARTKGTGTVLLAATSPCSADTSPSIVRMMMVMVVVIMRMMEMWMMPIREMESRAIPTVIVPR
jgi:hypothetical protein